MRTREIRHHGDGEQAQSRDRVDELDLEVLEDQQRRVIERLEAAAGGVVSYAELREAGVEFPASVISELELAGVPIERCTEGAAGAHRLAGVRLDGRGRRSSSVARAPSPVAGVRAPLPAPVPAEEQRGSARRRLLALAAAGAALLALGILAGLLLAGGRSPTPQRASAPRHAGGHPVKTTVRASHTTTVGASTTTARSPTTHTTTAPVRTAPARRPPSTPVSPALATALEARGHTLLDTGRYSQAIPTLRRAVATTGETLAACLEPASANCLTYAYALYDLGHALQLSGDAGAAVPVLERRLQIDNQRAAVAAELAVARAQEGASGARGPAR
jgi:tetratricopeptide (TPR) repeat protein